MMNYAETLKYIMEALPMFQRDGSTAYKADIEISEALDMYDGMPHREYITVHVGGTNGKGSVSHMLCAVLMAAGVKVGLFTSPHLVDYRERIRVNGEKIREEYVTEYVNSHLEVFQEYAPSFFEMSTAMAFSYFAHEHVDVAIIEVGMGGRLDSTNVINPAVSIITNIAMDHTEFLGDTLADIAMEKAGIIKPNTPVVLGRTIQETKRPLISAARRLKAPYVIASERWKCAEYVVNENSQTFVFQDRRSSESVKVETDLMGRMQLRNIPTVLCALDYLKWEGLNISERAMLDGLAHAQARTHLLGRWQILGRKPFVVCDTAHNPDGIRKLSKQIQEVPCEEKHFVLGLSGDKDARKILEYFPTDGKYYFTQSSVKRAYPVEELAEIAHSIGLNGALYPTVEAAVEAALSEVTPEGMLLIGGSSFVVADLLSLDKYRHFAS